MVGGLVFEATVLVSESGGTPLDETGELGILLWEESCGDDCR